MCFSSDDGWILTGGLSALKGASHLISRLGFIALERVPSSVSLFSNVNAMFFFVRARVIRGKSPRTHEPTNP